MPRGLWIRCLRWAGRPRRDVQRDPRPRSEITTLASAYRMAGTQLPKAASRGGGKDGSEHDPRQVRALAAEAFGHRRAKRSRIDAVRAMLGLSTYAREMG